MLFKILLFSFLLYFPTSSQFSFDCQADFPRGTYQILDENSGQMRSEVEFYKEGNELRARIKKLKSGYEDAVCNKCPDNFNGKKLLGMDLIWDLKWDGNRWSGGRILDVDNGKIYSCRINDFSDGAVTIRAYLGGPLFGETLNWPLK